jgi:iron-only hydrogenase group A
MGKMIINGRECEYTSEKNVLEIIRNQGFNVPTLCYRKDLLKDFGACRLCMVEVVGRGLQAACNLPPRENMEIKTETGKLRKIRKTILELLIANHDKECTACDKSGNCELQKYAMEYNVEPSGKYMQRTTLHEIDKSSCSIVRDANKCILCGACVRACDEYQGIQVLGFANRGNETVAQPMAGKPLKDSECVNCGQCAATCPTGAITIKSQIEEVWNVLHNPDKKVVVQYAPSVRVAIGEMFGFEPGENLTKKLNSALKWLGFDLVFDTNFSADLTIMEEAQEFVTRLQNNDNIPMFTSCCPAWVRFLELQHPDMLKHLSSCKSPQGMMGAIIRKFVPKYYSEITDENLVSVAIMPCTAKKAEAVREQFRRPDGSYEIDYVLTTQEIGKMIQSIGIKLRKIKDAEADSPFGKYSGAGTIFGVSGGVAEAAVRTAYTIVTGEDIQNLEINEIRGTDRNKSVELDLQGKKIKVKVVNTLREAEKCIQEIKAGTADYQMLEVMACPGGCINGGGQPISCNESEIKELRANGLYKDDKDGQWRKSHENPDIKQLYEKHLEKPNSHLAHELLHTSYSNLRKDCYISIGEKE